MSKHYSIYTLILKRIHFDGICTDTDFPFFFPINDRYNRVVKEIPKMSHIMLMKQGFVQLHFPQRITITHSLTYDKNTALFLENVL